MLNILIVEDEYNLRTFLNEVLSSRGYNCFNAEDGKKALELIELNSIDLIITDVMMPHIDGNKLVKRIRMDDQDTPIIMLTALGTYHDKEVGYDSGIDQYIVKPVDIKELNLVIKALLRRAKKASNYKIAFGDTVLNYQTKECLIKGKSIILANKEFELLYLLLSSPDKIYTRNQIMDQVWGYGSEFFDRTVDTHIKKIRAKVKSDDFDIITSRGLGYKGVIK